MDPFLLVSYPNENKPSSPWVRHLTNSSENLFTVLTNIWIRKYLLITKSIVTIYKHILMTFCYVFRAEEVAPHDFLFRRKSASRHFLLWGHATRLPFCSQTVWLGAKGVASKGIPCGFSSPKGIPHGSTRAKTWAKTCPTTAAKCEQSEPRLHSSGTLLPFPNAIWDVGWIFVNWLIG